MRNFSSYLALCLLSVGVLFFTLGFKAKRHVERLKSEGVAVPGVISQTEVQKGSKGKKSHILRVTWGVGTAKREQQRFVVNKAFFSARVRDDGTVSDPKVTVRYLPGEEDNAILEGGSSDLSVLEYLGLAFAGLGGFIAIRAILRRRVT